MLGSPARLARYTARRLGQAVIVLFGVSIAAFAMLHIAPGDPVREMLGVRATPVAVQHVRSELGLDRSLPSQYLSFVGHALQGNLGTSIFQQTSVAGLIGAHALVSLELAVYSSVISVLLALPLAIWSAVRRNRLADHAIRLATVTTFAMPPFWLGLILILVFSVQLGVFAPSGYGQGFAGHLENLTLPALTLALGLAPLLLRTLRTSMIETMRTDFVEAAVARGLSWRQVMLHYIVRNSLISSVTVLGVNFGYMVGGVVVVENVYALPGLGSMLVTGVQNRDFPLVQGLVLAFAIVIILINLATDLAYALIDPRVRL